MAIGNDLNLAANALSSYFSFCAKKIEYSCKLAKNTKCTRGRYTKTGLNYIHMNVYFYRQKIQFKTREFPEKKLVGGL